jgi:hypothetical protein
MSKFCFVCHTNSNSQHECKKNHEGISGGMERAGVLNIFKCSLHTRGIYYTKYLGDGDSKSYQRVVAGKPCDLNTDVTKLECPRHVQRSTGVRLRRLVKEKTGTKLQTANLLEAKVASLSLKWTNYKIIMVYPSGGMSAIWRS